MERWDNMLDNTPDTLTLKELEELLQIGKTSALRLVNEGRLAGHKICGKWIFLKEDILEYIKNRLMLLRQGKAFPCLILAGSV